MLGEKVAGNYSSMTTPELLHAMRGQPVASGPFITMNGELSLRLAESQFRVADAQVRAARLQIAAVIAMFLAVVATLAAPWIAHIY